MRCAITVVLAVWAALSLAFATDALAQVPQSARVASRPSVVRLPPAPQRCLRALDGRCTKLAVVESVRLRALVFSTLRVSYYGSPMGTVPGGNIERFFKDNTTLFGLPTAVYSPGGCCIIYSK